MQSGGQYGIHDIQQLMMERCPPPRMFALSPDMLPQPMKHPRLHPQSTPHLFMPFPLDHHYQHSLATHHAQQQAMQEQQQAMQEQIGLGDDSSENQSSFANRTAIQAETEDDDDGIVGEDDEDNSDGWATEETLHLLRVYSELHLKFRDSNLQAAPWEDVSRKLAELGYHRSAKACKEKIEQVNLTSEKAKDGKSFMQFGELEAVYNGGSRVNNGGAPNAALQEEVDAKSEQQNKKKRKRKHLASIKTFLENLVKQLLENQEALHGKFLEAIERRDQERIIREEAWKRQEMSRLTRETELRAQEQALASTREAAIVAFLQKITGQDLKLPEAPVPTHATETQEDHQAACMDKDISDPNGKRWPKPEVQALIRLRSNLEPKFQEPGPKGPLWQEVSAGMASQGFNNRSAKRCKEKWENINKYFRKTKDSMKKRPENAKTCPYFHQLDVLYRKGILSSPNKCNRVDQNSNSSDAMLEDQDHGLESNHQDDLREHIQASRSDSEHMISVIPADCEEITPANNTDNVYFFRSPDPVDHGHQMTKLKQNLPENNQNTSKSASPNVESGTTIRNAGIFSTDNSKAASKMERMVKDMLEAQQQQQKRFLEVFERREQIQNQHLHHHQQHQELRDQEEFSCQQNELKLIQERSQSATQSALMALVDKLTAEIGGDYSIHVPSAKR